jgi:uncharacterized membrane protein (DUF373 family)
MRGASQVLRQTGIMTPDLDAGTRSGVSPQVPRSILRTLTVAEDCIYLAVAVVLVGIATALLYQTVADAFEGGHPFVETITTAVSGVLFVVIVLEIFRTVLAHLEGGGFQLRPFLVIGVISAVRHVLLVGAQSVLHNGDRAFNHAQIELGVNAAVAVALVAALVLVHRVGAMNDREPKR